MEELFKAIVLEAEYQFDIQTVFGFQIVNRVTWFEEVFPIR